MALVPASAFLLVLAAAAGLAAMGYETQVAWPAAIDARDPQAATEALLQRSTIAVAVILGVWLVGYLLSFHPRRRARPHVLLCITGFLAAASASLPAREALTAFGIIFEEVEAPKTDAYFLGLLALGLVPLVLYSGFEWINRLVWPALANHFDRRDWAGPALMANRISLLFKPGQRGTLRSVALARFRRGVRGEPVTVLKQLYEEGSRDPEILECLCKAAAEEANPEAHLRHLRELREQFPEDEDIREALIEDLYDQQKFSEALEEIETIKVPDNEEALGRYTTALLAVGRLEDATEAARRLGEVEGIPFTQSQKLLREVLARMQEYTPALNALAAQAQRMALREQRIRWLEKSLEADPRQRDVRMELVGIYRDIERPDRLEALLRDIVDGDTTDWELQQEFLRILVANGSNGEALARLAKLNLNEKAPAELMLMEAELLFEEGDLAKASEKGRLVAARNPDDEQRKRVATLENRIERATLTAELASLLEEADAEPENLPLQKRALQKLIDGGHAEKVLAISDRVLDKHPDAFDEIIAMLEAYSQTPDVPFTVLNYLADRLADRKQFDRTLNVIRVMEGRSMDPVMTARDGSQKILRRSPHHLGTLRYLGDLSARHGRSTDMVHSYSLYLSHGGEKTREITEALAKAYLSLRDYNNARGHIMDLLAENPEDADLLRQALPLAIESEQVEDAADFLKRLELVAPRDKETRAFKRRVDMALGRRRFDVLKAELDAGKGGAETLEQLGDLASAMENHGDAITYYQRAARSADEPLFSRRCTAKLALAYMRKRLDDLCQETLRTISISPREENREELATVMDILYQIGELFLEAKQFNRAERIFKDLCNVDAGYRDVLEKVEALRS